MVLFLLVMKVLSLVKRIPPLFRVQIGEGEIFFTMGFAFLCRVAGLLNTRSHNENFPMHERYLHCYTPFNREKPDTPRFLVTLDVGIGDAVALGLRALEQIIENDPLATGAIDVLCNNLQAQVFACDPRINRIIETDKVFFPGIHMSQWLRGIILDSEAAQVVHFLRQRYYEAVFPSVIAPGLYFRLNSHIMYPHLFEMGRNFLELRKRLAIHESAIVKHMVNHYFKKARLAAVQNENVSLYISSNHVQKAMETIETLKERAFIEEKDGEVLIIAPDTASAVTRPPVNLLAATLCSVLAARPKLLVYILPSYTETARSLRLLEVLSKDYPFRAFLMPSEPRAHLLEVAALIDQADIFVTGDTGVMHLAAAHKTIREEDDTRFVPRNSVKMIALFGGTSPSYFGYSKNTTIVGWGRKEQRNLFPGFFKGCYNLKGRNLFDHISSQQVAEAILA